MDKSQINELYKVVQQKTQRFNELSKIIGENTSGDNSFSTEALDDLDVARKEWWNATRAYLHAVKEFNKQKFT